MDSPQGAQHQRVVMWLLIVGIVARLIPHPWNATPVMAIALFGGTWLAKRWAVLLPLGIVALSDVILGWHNTIPFTWGAFALTGLLAWWIRLAPSAWRIVTASLAGSSLFFIVTNFGVWVVGGLYPRTAEGLALCYVAALPFFRNQLSGDLFYTTALFGAFALLTQIRRRAASVRAQ
jgi:hypothetical protein